MGRLLKDIAGQRFGRLLVLCRCNPMKPTTFMCRCDCGIESPVRASGLTTGRTNSCGCLQKELASKRFKRHGGSGVKRSRTYSIWANMIQRCTNQNNKNWPRYGGRGITVCNRWKDFSNFLADMGNAPDSYEIDRIKNDGNYEYGNCRWATRKEQTRNHSRNRMLEYQEKVQPLSQWVEELGLNYWRVKQRLNSGWSVSDAFTLPLMREKNAA